MTNKEVFDKYAHQFNLKDDAIKGKYTHSFRVMEISKELAKSLNLSDNDVELASNIGLLHDIGRFRQLKEYFSYDDIKTIDHADFGADLLFKEGKIKDFNINKNDYRIIEKAIRNHNKLEIEGNLNDRDLLFSKIIRDADELDILYRICILKDLPCKIDINKKISDKVKESFFNKMLVKKIDKENYNDGIITALAFIFDINYDFSYKWLIKYNIIENFKKVVDNEMFNEYYDFIDKYIKERNDKNVR